MGSRGGSKITSKRTFDVPNNRRMVPLLSFPVVSSLLIETSITHQPLPKKEGLIFYHMDKQTERVAEIEISYRPAISRKPLIQTSFDAYTEIIEFFPEETIALNERFVVMYLNRRNRVLGVYELSKGGISATVVDLRLLFSIALKIAATAVVLAHNHPSGSLTPSNADHDITEKIKQAAGLLDIKIIDHLIVSHESKYYSFADEGLL